jgi:serine/threonine-protein kinase
MAELGALLGGRYRLDQVLGQGGMATIFRATDDNLGREVAVKVLRPEFGSDAQFVERFEHEAQSAASLSHPNIVQVYDYGTDPAGPYIVMEQVAGGDLSAVLGERGALPPTAVARTGQQVADALATAHARGLVHRDIKPSNILLSPDGRVQVADFGIAQAAAGSPVTATGITLGSVLYFSPEQARGDTATAASDIYSLGLVLYEMLTGQRAFSGDSPAAVAVARLSGGVPSPMAVRAEVPPSLDAIVRWCLATDPAARPSGAELSAALARFITDPSGAASFPAAAGVATSASAPAQVPPRAPGAPPPPTQTVLVAGPTLPPADPERSGSGPWAWLAAGLGLLVIIASGILLFLLFSGIGEEAATPSPSPSPTIELVKTPDFIGKREVNAANTAEKRGLQLEIDYIETDEYDADRVIEQLPEPGIEIPVGSSVQLTVTTQVETVVVPDVHNIREDRAIEQLEAAGLQAGTSSTRENPLPAGYVIETDPRAGASVVRGSLVDYVLSSGPSTEATARPPSSTPTPRVTAEPTSRPPASLAPSPFPSQEIVLVFRYLCLDLGTARAQLDEAGLLVGATFPDPAPDDSWIVHDQKPQPGESVPIGSKVDLVLMDPSEPCSG